MRSCSLMSEQVKLVLSFPLKRLALMEFQAIGGRQSQEDRYTIILPDQFPADTDDKLAFFAIYDGQYGLTRRS